MSDFDPIKALAEARASYAPGVANRLSFPDQCAIYAARKGAQRSVLAAAFGVTKSTVSLIANSKPGRGRYHAVAREVERLGALEFDRRYYTDEIHTRIMRLKYDRAEVGDNRTFTAPNPRADAYAFINRRAFLAGDVWHRVDWLTVDGAAGWYATYCDERGALLDKPFGKEVFGDGLQPITPYRTSAEAFDAPFLMQLLDSPRPKAGRPKNHP
jgi:hypothetical protein